MSLPCSRCGLDPRTMLDGYAPPEDVDLVLEGLGPHILQRLAQALRDGEAGTLNESLVFRLDRAKNGSMSWTLGREAVERVQLPTRRKRA
jgi:hypothetical protein